MINGALSQIEHISRPIVYYLLLPPTQPKASAQPFRPSAPGGYHLETYYCDTRSRGGANMTCVPLSSFSIATSSAQQA